MAIQSLFVPRHRLATFTVRVRLDDLNNVPPLNGQFYIKWRCQDYSGSSTRESVVNREVRWAQTIEKELNIPVNKDGVLSPCEMKLVVKQEMYHHVRTKIGVISVNLSEYAKLAPSSRRYFLKECKLNCTLKLSINISQIDGPSGFQTPPLDRSMLLSDFNDMVINNNNESARSFNENSVNLGSMHNINSSNNNGSIVSGRVNSNSKKDDYSIRTSTGSNTTQTSRHLLPIDDYTNVRDLAPFQSSSRKNQRIVDDVFMLS